MEGFLPARDAIAWSAVAAPFVMAGVRSVERSLAQKPRLKALLGVAIAFTFALSALKLPSVTGSCSHPTGVGLGTILFGPLVMALTSSVVLLFQALLLAHGGITTLGANTFSMGVVGPLITYMVFRLARKGGLGIGPSVFAAAVSGNIATYLTTSLQLALAYPDPTGGIILSLVKFAGIFAVTQVPLAVTEGLLTVMMVNLLLAYSTSEMRTLGLIVGGGKQV
ncbi:MAG: energy-coupling factor ABC transporter permease [Bacillota bacterium]